MKTFFETRGYVFILIIICAGCADEIQNQNRAGLQGTSIIDLSHTYDENTIYWPTSPSAFEFKQLDYGHTEGGYFYSANSFCTPEHGGTHIDAPIHFAEAKQTVAQIPVDRLVALAVVIDVSESAKVNQDYQLNMEDIEQWEAINGRIPEHALVVLRTGWESRWGNTISYLGDDTPNDASNLHFPSFGAAAVKFLIDERKIVGIGVDTASIDTGSSKDFMVHRIAASANVFGLENLMNLDLLPASGATIIALPMKIAGGSGGPVRVIAVLPDNI